MATALQKKQILSFVKQQCKLCGVKFLLRREYEHLGSFDSSERTLTIAKTFKLGKGKRKGKPRVRVSPDDLFLITALHEMVHMLQWKRKDPNWIAKHGKDDLTAVILEYAAGDASHPKELLVKSAKALLVLELEAEFTSIRLLELFGVDQHRSNNIRDAKAYAYSYLVLAETGIMVDRRGRDKWKKFLTNDTSPEITKATFTKMCEIAKETKESAYTVWEGKKCVKANWG